MVEVRSELQRVREIVMDVGTILARVSSDDIAAKAAKDTASGRDDRQ